MKEFNQIFEEAQLKMIQDPPAIFSCEIYPRMKKDKIINRIE